VAKPPTNFNEAVEEVKQWNEALKSPAGAGSFRNSTSSKSQSQLGSPLPTRRDPPLRNVHNDQHAMNLVTPTKGPLSLAKPRAFSADIFRSPETTSKQNPTLKSVYRN
jgi:hypothetical protein